MHDILLGNKISTFFLYNQIVLPLLCIILRLPIWKIPK